MSAAVSRRSAYAGYEDRVRRSFEQQVFMATLDATLSYVREGEVAVAVVPASRLTQQHGYVHAGVVTTIADTACGYAAYTLMPPGHEVLSVEFKINLLAPAVGHSLEACARVIRAGRLLSTCQADVFAMTDEGSAQVATMLATILGRPMRRRTE